MDVPASAWRVPEALARVHWRFSISATLILLIVLVLVALLLGAWFVAIFNRLVTLRNRYKNAFDQMPTNVTSTRAWRRSWTV